MNAVFAIAKKDLTILIRDRFGLFWVILFPLLMALFFGSMFSSDNSGIRGMHVAFVTDNLSPTSEAFYAELEQSDVISAVRLSADSAQYLVSRGKLSAYISYIDTSESALGIFSGSMPSIKVGIDPSRNAESGYLQGLVNQAYFTQLQKKLTDPSTFLESFDDQLASLSADSNLSSDQKQYLTKMLSGLKEFMQSVNQEDSLTTDSAQSDSEIVNAGPFGQPDIEFIAVSVSHDGPQSTWEITFPQSLQWVLIGCTAAFALSIVTERTRGTYSRLRLAPITTAHILLGKGLACATAAFSVCLLLMLIGIFIFGIHIASYPLLIIALISSVYCFVGLMMLISVLGKTEQAVGGAGWAILLVMSMTGGGMIPLAFMPSWMTNINSLSPVKWSVLAIEGAIWRGFDLSDMMLPVAVLLIAGTTACIIASSLLLRADK